MPLAAQLREHGYALERREADRFNRYRFTLYQDDTVIGTGTHFRGGNHIRPWIEFQPRTSFTDQDQALFNAMTAALIPGSHIMVHYLRDTATARAITENVPPAATPLGLLMWRAGVRWFKDWYFTEGWMEGDQKLQGNLPLNNEVKQEREQEMTARLQAFLDDDTDHPACRERAAALLTELR